MRNLQKILALVLALVMSLSLMATAGARDFTDGDQIDETFAESVDVLTGLEVFQGYPTGDFQPKGDITRAEVAAIIYRIATGDVTDSQVGIYADYNKFSDVPSDNWAAGYINYCANAEYIKGRGDGKFYPQDKVTGYEALAMILRVVGYDKNGEFTGADWQVQTAATANQRKVTKNVNAGTLGNPASRETVAELLCQAILIEKVNYTLAFGYQISTNPEDTIAYETFKMEKLEGVVTGNEIADLKESSPLAAGQTRLVIDGREEIVDIPTTLDKIGKSVRAYIRPQGGTTRKQLVTDDVYDTELNNVYDSFASVSSVGNSTGSDNGINSIAGAEHFINYDFVNRWTASIRITYTMDVKWTQYQAFSMRRDNGGKLYPYVKDANMATRTDEITGINSNSNTADWSTLLTTDADYTYTYTKSIPLDEMLTSDDYNNLYSIFTNADRTDRNKTWMVGEVYVGTASFNAQDDISDDIRWTDFTNTYLRNEATRQQVEKNGRGNRLIIIDNDDDGIAEYVLQTIYTIAKVSTDAKYVDNLNTKLYDSSNSDAVNSTSTSDTLVSVSGKELAKSEETLNSGDVVIYALIDGNIRAQKAEIKTEKVNTVNRAGKTITVVGEDAATYNESAVHTHSNGLKSYVSGMVGNTTYTMYFDLDGNLAAYTEGANGGLVLITNGWYRSTIGGPEYAVQAYLDGALQTVNVSTNGSLFIQPGTDTGNNNWNNLKHTFGTNNNINNEGQPDRQGIHTIVANLDGEILTPVDKAYLYSQQLRMLDMKDNVIPGRDNNSNNNPISWGIPYETNYSNGTAYTAKDVDDPNTSHPSKPADNEHYEVRALSNTVYYTVYRGIGYDNVTNADQNIGLNNVVVRSYTGYNNVPSIDKKYIEDVYVVGAKAHAIENSNSPVYYTAQVVVIELGSEYNKYDSEQVFIPDFSEVTNSVGIENVTMIRGNGVKETVQVDMTKSHIDSSYYYDPANGSIHGNRIPGLYFMDPSDSDPNVYVIQRMTPADVRDNDYLVGYVRESYNTLSNNYAQINTRVRPAGAGAGYVDELSWKWETAWFGGNDDLIAANATTPKTPGFSAEWQSKAFGTDSKAYTYGGSTASLNEVPATEALAQYRQDNAGTTISGLNERWNGESPATDPLAFNQNNLNEVLVRYSGGTVVYAISFNETDNKAAQKVWWNYLPLDGQPEIKNAPTLTFGNQPVTLDENRHFIKELSWAEAGDPIVITVEGGKFQHNNQKVFEVSRKDSEDNVIRGTIIGDDGEAYSYTLTQKAKQTTGGEYLDVKDSYKNRVRVTSGHVEVRGADVTVQTVIDALYMRGDAKIDANSFVFLDSHGNPVAREAQAQGAATVSFKWIDVNGVPHDMTWPVAIGSNWDANTDKQIKVMITGTAANDVKVFTAWTDLGASGNQEAQKNTDGSYTFIGNQSIMVVLEGSDKSATVRKVKFSYGSNNGHSGMNIMGNAENTSGGALYFAALNQNVGIANLTIKVDYVDNPDVTISADGKTMTYSTPNATVETSTAIKTADNNVEKIDLNNNTVKVNGARAIEVKSDKSLTVENGTIEMLDTNPAVVISAAASGTRSGSAATNVTLKNVTIKGKTSGLVGIGKNVSGVTLTLEDCILDNTTGDFAVFANGLSTGNTVNLINCTISNSGTAKEPTVYFAGANTYTINGGTITGATAVEVRKGSLNVLGGAVLSGSTTYTTPVMNGEGSTSKGGVGLCVHPHAGSTANTNVTVQSGVTLSGAYGLDLVSLDTPNANTTHTVNLYTTGTVVNMANGGKWTTSSTTGAANATYTWEYTGDQQASVVAE